MIIHRYSGVNSIFRGTSTLFLRIICNVHKIIHDNNRIVDDLQSINNNNNINNGIICKKILISVFIVIRSICRFIHSLAYKNDYSIWDTLREEAKYNILSVIYILYRFSSQSDSLIFPHSSRVLIWFSVFSFNL